jgi:hypothetical protein
MRSPHDKQCPIAMCMADGIMESTCQTSSGRHIIAVLLPATTIHKARVIEQRSMERVRTGGDGLTWLNVYKHRLVRYLPFIHACCEEPYDINKWVGGHYSSYSGEQITEKSLALFETQKSKKTQLTCEVLP